MSLKAMWSLLLCSVLCAAGAWAAPVAPDGQARPGAGAGTMQFDTQIDTWAEGTVTNVNPTDGKFTIRGAKMPYATAYAEMMKDLAGKTRDLQPAERQAKEQEVRRNWQDRLAKARAETPTERESEITLSAPARNRLVVINESAVQQVDFLRQDRLAAGRLDATRADGTRADATRVDGTRADGTRADATRPGTGAAYQDPQPGTPVGTEQAMTLRDIKIGDRVMVGYDSGLITNEAYAVIKRQSGPQPASHVQPGMQR